MKRKNIYIEHSLHTGLGRAGSSPAILNLAFRPLYLLGAIFSAIALLVWISVLSGVSWRGGYLMKSDMIAWHVHEMVFGFAAVIVAGFLLTAVKAWTGIQTLRGKWLAWLVVLWLSGRVFVWFGPAGPAAVVDSLFLPVTAIAALRVLRQSGNRRNYFLAVVVFAYGILNALFHAAIIAGRPDMALRVADAAVGIVIFLFTVIGGRVIPMFSMNAVPGLTCRRWSCVERVTPLLTLAALWADALGIPAYVGLPLSCIACAVHVMRMYGWRSFRIWRPSILLILHVAYAWIPLGFCLLALSQAGHLSHSVAIHAFTVGAIGGAIIAMITRTARGHTGNRIAADRADVTSYLLIFTGAILRVFGPAIDPKNYGVWINVSGLVWAAAFSIYVVAYARRLWRPRIDGKPD